MADNRKKKALSPDGRILDIEKFFKSFLCECGWGIDCCYGALTAEDKITGDTRYGFVESGVLVWYLKEDIPPTYKG